MRRILFSILSFALLWAFAGTVQAAPTTRPTSQPTNKKTHHPHQHKAHAKKATKHKAHAGHHGHHGGKHNPSNPPIDCPLRKAGIHPNRLQPFKSVQKYIKMLERPDRLQWQKPDAVVKYLKLKGNEKLADVGAGSGYFSFRFARKLPRGQVYAIDVKAEMLRHIHHTSMMKGIKNVRIVFASYTNPKVPKDSDVVFICDVFHHVSKKKAWLKTLWGQMKKGSKVVFIEFRMGKLPKGPPAWIKLAPRKLRALLTAQGFKITDFNQKLLPYQYMMIAKKP